MASSTLSKIITAAERKIQEDAENVRIELATVTEALPALREKVADVKDDLSAEAEVKSRLKKGEEVPALDLLIARAEDEIADYRLRASESRIAILRKALPAPSTLLADKIAPAFQSVIPGVEVISTVAPLKTWRNDIAPGTTAVVLVVDPKVETDPFRQTLNGTVNAYFIRSGLMKPLSVAKVEAAHRNAKPGCSMTVRSNNVGDEGGFVSVAGSPEGNQTDPSALVLDTLACSVDGVIASLPVIAETTANSGLVKTWVMGIFGGYLKPGITTTARIVDVPDLPAGEAFCIRYGMGSVARAAHPKVSEDVVGNERTLLVRHTINLSHVDPVAFAVEMQDGAQDYVGGSYLSMGVLTSVAATPRHQGSVTAGIELVDVVCVFTSVTG